jgi:hypothetical protein
VANVEDVPRQPLLPPLAKETAQPTSAKMAKTETSV